MHQQINLYDYLQKPVKTFLTGGWFMRFFGGLLGFLLIVFILLCIEDSYLKHQVNTISAKLHKQEAALAALQLAHPEVDHPASKETNKSAACQVSFAAYMSALATAIEPKVWITQFSITHAGDTLNLQGHAMQASAIQKFIQNLKKQPEFTNLNFAINSIIQTSSAEAPMDFIITGVKKA